MAMAMMACRGRRRLVVLAVVVVLCGSVSTSSPSSSTHTGRRAAQLALLRSHFPMELSPDDDPTIVEGKVISAGGSSCRLVPPPSTRSSPNIESPPWMNSRWNRGVLKGRRRSFDDLAGVSSGLGMGYWTVVWEHEKQIMQHHYDEHGVSVAPGPILLGQFSGSSVSDAGRVDQYSSGEFCHDIRAPRSVTVSYQCCSPAEGETATLRSFSEPETCQYTIVVCTLAVCRETMPDSEPAAKHSLQNINSKTCYRRAAGYWTYEVCMGKFVRQFHAETTGTGTKDKKTVITSEFILGRFDKASVEGPGGYHEVVLDTDNPSQSRYIQRYVNGTECDSPDLVAGDFPMKRATVVTIRCPTGWGVEPFEGDFAARAKGNHDPYAYHPVSPYAVLNAGNVVMTVEETSTCAYDVTLELPYVCSHQHFEPRPTPPLRFECTGDQDLNGWRPPA